MRKLQTSLSLSLKKYSINICYFDNQGKIVNHVKKTPVLS